MGKLAQSAALPVEIRMYRFDIALARAIGEGRRWEDVGRGEVLSLLEGGH